MNKKKLIIGGSAAGVILVAAIFGFVFLKDIHPVLQTVEIWCMWIL